MDPTWPPKTESALQLAVGSGAFEERHWVDVKRELGKGEPANKELAADLASFAAAGL